MTGKRKPGRPKGSFKKGDGKYLDEVADLLTRDTTRKKTPTIACVVEKNFPQHQWKTAERRLLRRWNETATDRLSAARDRNVERPRNRSSGVFDTSRYLSDINVASVEGMVNQMSIMQQIAEPMETPIERALRATESPWEQIMRTLEAKYIRAAIPLETALVRRYSE